MINEKYIIKEKLGEGRSRVFLCEDTDYPGKNLTIKILPAEVSAEEAESFGDEYFTLRKLNHPNIIQAIDIGTVLLNDTQEFEITPGCRFITLEYFEGDHLLIFNIKNEDQVRSIIKEISSVLFYLHQSNYTYYDLKPENILISEKDGKTVVKLIDLGFARTVHNNRSFSVRGTAEYIAPEILNNTTHDHRADLYSFGMLLYRLIYKKFPFEAANELEIYKAHISGNFEFPPSDFSDDLIDVIKKLLSKEPQLRYTSTLQVLEHLKIPFEDIRKEWVPVKSFTNRKDVLAIINSFVHKQSESEVFAIRGTEGAGKTSLLEKIFERYNNAVFIRSSRYTGNNTFWKTLLREIVFSDFIYSSLPEDILQSAFELLKKEPSDLIDTLKTILRNAAREKSFILLLDEYNRYDELSLEIMKEIVPILQIQNVKLVVSEDSSFPYLTDTINNLTAVNLTPFTEAQLIEYLDKSLASFYPKNEVKRLIMRYADLLPGSIDSFLRDIVQFDILKFNSGVLSVEAEEEKLKLLSCSQDEIYNLQLGLLTAEELNASRMLSLFEISISDEIFSALLGLDITITIKIINSLREKNILSPANISIYPEFTSEGLRRHIYNNITDKNSYHLTAAEILEKNYPDFSRVELARHFESAGLFYRSYEKLKEELKSAERLSAFSYKKKILIHIAEFPLVESDINEIKFDLALTHFRIGDKKSALNIINYLLNTKIKTDRLLELKVLQGNCLIYTGELTRGIEILSVVLPSIKQDSKKQEILFDIASAEFDLNNYSRAGELSRTIIENPHTNIETRGKSYNLLGLIELYEKANYEDAINYLEKAFDVYNLAKMMGNLAGIALNLGNIYDMKGDHDNAEMYWNKAMQINQSVGNEEQEAKVLLL